MPGYRRPKKRLHREFLYLNYDTVINSLSAIEAGMVDEIIEKTTEGGEGGLEAGIGYGPAKVSAGKKKHSNLQAELVRTRTRFSAFDAWHQYLKEQEALGTFDDWNREIRDELRVGDTIEFDAELTIGPLHKMFTIYRAFVDSAGKPGSINQLKGQELAEAKKTAQMIGSWIAGPTGHPNVPVNIAPLGISQPLIVARLDAQYMIGTLADAEGRFTVIGQVSALLKDQDRVAAIRIVREVPPTPKEIEVSTEAMKLLIEPTKEFGLVISEDDLTLRPPAVILSPVAVFK